MRDPSKPQKHFPYPPACHWTDTTQRSTSAARGRLEGKNLTDASPFRSTREDLRAVSSPLLLHTSVKRSKPTARNFTSWNTYICGRREADHCLQDCGARTTKGPRYSHGIVTAGASIHDSIRCGSSAGEMAVRMVWVWVNSRRCIRATLIATSFANHHPALLPSSGMGSARLPAELTDRIIDFCHNNKRTLSNCALTHSSWLAASRFHLFHTITTTGIHERTDRATQLKFNTRKRSSILPYIKTVKIESFANPNQVARLSNAAHLAHTIRQACDRGRLPIPPVHVTLRRYDSLWSLTLSLINDIVTCLKLSDVTFGHPNDVWPFLSSFPRLQHLELGGVGFNLGESGFPVERIFEGIPLTTIRITTSSMGFVIGSLAKVAGSLSYLEGFGIAYEDNRQGALLQLADAIQGKVKCLRFSADCYPGDERLDDWRPSTFDTGERPTGPLLLGS